MSRVYVNVGRLVEILSAVHPGSLVLQRAGQMVVFEVDKDRCALRERKNYQVDYLAVRGAELAALVDPFFASASGHCLGDCDNACLTCDADQKAAFAALFPEF